MNDNARFHSLMTAELITELRQFLEPRLSDEDMTVVRRYVKQIITGMHHTYVTHFLGDDEL